MTSAFDDEFAVKVTKKCYELYKTVSVQKKKVLSSREWTNMACILQTKCMPGMAIILWLISRREVHVFYSKYEILTNTGVCDFSCINDF